MDTSVRGSLELVEAADRYRPASAEALEAEIRRLYGSGMSENTISWALRLDPAYVASVVGEP